VVNDSGDGRESRLALLVAQVSWQCKQEFLFIYFLLKSIFGKEHPG